MKKFLFFSSLAFIALVFLPQRMMAEDCSFTPNLFPGQSADRTANEINATVKVGEYGACTTHMYSQISGLKSTNTSVVTTYNQGGYDAVFFVGAGTADVTYTEYWFNTSAGGGAEGGGASGGASGGGSAGGDGGGTGSTVCPSSHTIHYTVEKGTPQAYAADPEKGDPVTDYTTTPNEFKLPQIMIMIKTYRAASGSSYPQMVSQNMGYNANEVTITSSNPNVVEVGRGNSMMYKGLGETEITATWPGNANWNGATVSYKLTVEQGKQNVSLAFRNSQVSDTVGKTIPAQTPIMRPEVSPIVWYSTQPSVASIDATTGQITTHTRGTTWIHATFAGNETYKEADGAYCLTVIGKDPKLSFDSPFGQAELGVPAVPQKLNNPYNRPVVWTSSNTAIAEIAADGSSITPKKTGEVQIYASIADPDDPVYFYQQVSYTLQVSTIGISVMGVNITSLNANDVLGDGKVTFDRNERTLHLYNFHADVREMSSEIKQGVIREAEGQMTIMLHGNCSITGAERCIYAPSAGVVIRSESKKDTVTLRADASDGAIAILANGLKMHEALFFATGKQAAIQGVYLSVTKWGHVFAEALYENGGEAIRVQDFQKGEGGIGGIDILTPDVEWHGEKGSPIGFFSKSGGKAVRMVEIGKVPMPVPTDEQTNIAFTEDPEDNDNAVFCASDNDTFNQETQQLEISSSFTHEQVETALETLVPGSSAWVEQLPGTLIFDVPAGQGEFELKCKTEPGFTFQVKIEGKAAVTVTSTKIGWVKVEYDVAEQTHVIVYLNQQGQAAAPARVRAAEQDEPSVGGYVEAIKITPKASVPTDIGTLPQATDKVQKCIKAGQVLIIRGDKAYTVTGQEL